MSPLKEGNAKLKAVIVDLKRKLNLYSTNSNIPPSTYEFNKKKMWCSRMAYMINLQFETNQDKIDEKVDIKPTFCSECKTPLENFILIDTRQTHDI